MHNAINKNHKTLIVLQYLSELHGNKFESSLLKPLESIPDESTLDAIRLDHDVGTLCLIHLHKLELAG